MKGELEKGLQLRLEGNQCGQELTGAQTWLSLPPSPPPPACQVCDSSHQDGPVTCFEHKGPSSSWPQEARRLLLPLSWLPGPPSLTAPVVSKAHQAPAIRATNKDHFAWPMDLLQQTLQGTEMSCHRPPNPPPPALPKVQPWEQRHACGFQPQSVFMVGSHQQRDVLGSSSLSFAVGEWGSSGLVSRW